MRGTTFQTIASVAALATGAIAADLKCVKGLHIIVARGTTEEPGTGITGMVADEIAGKISDSQVLALDYPASFTDPDYVDSEGEGATMMKKQILDYHKACPDGKMALMGYSQVGLIWACDVWPCCGKTGSVEMLTMWYCRVPNSLWMPSAAVQEMASILSRLSHKILLTAAVSVFSSQTKHVPAITDKRL